MACRLLLRRRARRAAHILALINESIPELQRSITPPGSDDVDARALLPDQGKFSSFGPLHRATSTAITIERFNTLLFLLLHGPVEGDGNWISGQCGKT
jgi:hypothetical protein